jgi:hypothetical protein
MPWVDSAKNAMLDSMTVNNIRLHSGLPGVGGTSNALGAGYSSATFAAASAGERVLSSDVLVSGLAASQSVTHVSFWTGSGSTYRGFAAVTGDIAANASGEYTVKASTTKLTLSDS